MTFYIIFKIFLPLIIFLLIYSFYVLIKSSESNFVIGIDQFTYSKEYNQLLEKGWQKKRTLHFLNLPVKIILILFTRILFHLKYSIIDYINKNYEPNENEEVEENSNSKNDQINEVNTSLIINNIKYNTIIKLNHILYLQRIDSSGKENIFKFKKIKIQNITENFIYVRLGMNSVSDQISLVEWNYPDLNPIFLRLAEMCNNIYIILFFSVGLFKCI